MATVAVAQTTNSTQNRGPRGSGKRGKGKGNRGGRGGGGARPAQGEAPKNDKAGAEATVDKNEEDAQDDAGICWICAEPVKYYAVPECNHQTCHVCSLRLRALYKKNECTFCKEPQPSMVFTASAEAQFSSFAPETMPFKDAKLSVFFETQEMMEETLLLLRFNCPDPACDFIGNGWSDVKLHARATHGRLMCDLCIRHKKVFAHEHTLYQPNILPLHLPSMQSAARPSRPAKGKDKEQIEGGVHPLCEFCRECFFGDDELYKHMRETHEECFICKRNDIRDQYFMNYPALENHFVRDHHPCPHPTCLARKFVVFGSALDLKAHAVEEHGAELGKDELRDARRIEPAWESGGHGRGRGRGQERERPRDRAREGPPPPPQAPAAGPARPPAGGRRREGFGAQLTVEGESPAPTPARTPSPTRADVDPVVAVRHAAFLQRLSALAAHPATAVQSARAAIRSFRASESTARGLISTLYSIVDSRMEATSSVVNALVDLFDTPSDVEQREAILGAWRDFEVSQRQQFPDLVPSAVGGGFAGIASGRVLNAKHATATRAGRGGAVLDRVAQAAAQDRFPALSSSLSSVPGAGPRLVPGQRNTPWSGSSSSSKPTGFAASSLFVPPPVGGSAPAVVVPRSENVAGSGGGGNHKAGPPPKLSSALFPELPTRQKTAVQVKGNQSLKNILGQGAAGTGAWGSGSGSGASSGTSTPVVSVASGAAEPTEEDAGLAGTGGAAAGAGGGKKKGKGKQKQTLFTLGAFPS